MPPSAVSPTRPFLPDLAAFSLFLLLVAFHTPGSVLLYAAVLAFAFSSWRHWHNKLSGILAIVIVTGVAIVTWRSPSGPDVANGLKRYASVIELMAGIALLQRVVARLDIQDLLFACARVSPRWRASVVGLASMLLVLPLSLATVALVTTVLGRVAQPRKTAALIAMRALSLSMIVLPMTVGSATVAAALPGLSTASVALAGLPVVIAGLLSLRLTRLDLIALPEIVPVKDTRIWWFLGLFCATLAAGLTADLPVPETIAIAGLALYLLNMWFDRQKPAHALHEVGSAWQRGSAEMLLLLACGLLLETVAGLGQAPWLTAFAQTYLRDPWIVSALVLTILPAIAACGVHPLILFNLVFPLINGAIMGGFALQYLMWTTMFVVAQLISPVSISPILAASALGVSPVDTSYKLHWRFSLSMCIGMYFYIQLLRLTHALPA